MLKSAIKIATSGCIPVRSALCIDPTLRRRLAMSLLGALSTAMLACSSVPPDSTGTVRTQEENRAAPQDDDQIGPNDARLTWDPVSHPDLGGYRVYYTFESLKYLVALGTVVDVGDATTHTLRDLSGGKRYWFAVIAYTSDGQQSEFSNIVSKDIP